MNLNNKDAIDFFFIMLKISVLKIGDSFVIKDKVINNNDEYLKILDKEMEKLPHILRYMYNNYSINYLYKD